MFALAAALMQIEALEGIPGLAGGALLVRRLSSDFEIFEREVLCAAVTPRTSLAADTPARLVGVDDAATLKRYETCTLAQVRVELRRWVEALHAPSSAPGELLRSEAMLLRSLLRNVDAQCVYRLAPLAAPEGRPVALVRLDVLQRHGRRAVLHALWSAELAAGAGGTDREYGALYDELLERIRNAAARKRGPSFGQGQRPSA